MKEKNNNFVDESTPNLSSDIPTTSKEQPQKGPLSFFTGALTSLLLAWICFGVSKNMVIYFTLHAPSYGSAIAQSIASGFKTLIIGTSFLATFTFAFIGLGLILVLFRSLFAAKNSVDH